MQSNHPNAKPIVWSIGIIPVQSWIAQASRSRDLRFGSLFLSHVVARTINRILTRFDHAEVVLPRTAGGAGPKDPRLAYFDVSIDKLMNNGDQFMYSLPNRATGVIEQADLNAAEKEFALLQTECVDRAWADLIDAVTRPQALKAACADTALRADIETGINNGTHPLHLIWCLAETELDASRRTQSVVETATGVYGKVKRTRPIKVFDGAPVGKCRTCGEREAIQPSDQATGEWPAWRAFQARLADDGQIKSGARFDAGAALCSVCATKRLGGYLGQQAFPSTARIASAIWHAQARELAPGLLGELENAIRQVPGFDQRYTDPAPLYYERTVAAKRRETSDGVVLAKIEAVEKAQSDVYRALADALEADHPVMPSPYLQVLVFDADDMGPAMSKEPEDIANRIDHFVQVLPGITNKHHATDFYIGGDEGLILCPVESGPALALDLQEEWQQQFEDAPTLSAGVCIFDFGQPLGRAIDVAHDAIAKAKTQQGKNTLAITVQMASGSAWSTLSPWGENWYRVAGAVLAMRGGYLAKGWPYDVQRMLRGLRIDTLAAGGDQRAATVQEIKRLTMRSRLEVSGLLASFDDLWERDLLGDTWLSDNTEVDTSQLVSQLQLIAFLARESRLGETIEGEHKHD